jgi:hypothetical protein
VERNGRRSRKWENGEFKDSGWIHGKEEIGVKHVRIWENDNDFIEKKHRKCWMEKKLWHLMNSVSCLIEE